MANLLINISDKESNGIQGIVVDCNFYLEYRNTTTGRRLTSSVLYNITGVSDFRDDIDLHGNDILSVKNITSSGTMRKWDASRASATRLSTPCR